MSWLTQTQLQNYLSAEMLIKLTDDTNDPSSTVDSTVVSEIISETEAEIAGVLALRYPAEALAKTSAVIITSIAKALAAMKLYIRRPDMGAAQTVIADIERKSEMLRQIADGTIAVTEWSSSGGETGIAYAQPQFDQDAPDDLVDWLDTREETDLA